MATDEMPIHPLRLCREVDAIADDNTIVVVDGGDILSFSRISLTRNKPGTYIGPGPFGAIGYGLPAALGAQVAAPESRVIALLGDGAFGINFMEMETAVRNGLPIVAVISNNSAWNIERQAQIVDFGPQYELGTALTEVRYDLMVKAMGGFGEYVTSPDEIKPAIERALASGLPACVNVVTAGDVVSPDLARGLSKVPADQPIEFTSVSE